MDVDALIDELIDREGGFVDHPADRGGATCWGVTEAAARAAGWRGAMRDLPRDFAVALYRRRYWDQPGFGKVAARAPRLAAEMFDTGVNMGVGTAIGFLQRALNALNRQARDWPDLVVDRRIGSATLAALDAYLVTRGPSAEAVLTRAVDSLQGARYIALAEARPTQEAFLYGWLATRTGEM